MAIQFDVEEQRFADEYGAIDEFTDGFFTPIAPVTIARAWCPIDSTERWLGRPKSLEMEPGVGVAGMWEGIDPFALDEVTTTTADEAHFRFLLALCLERADHEQANIMLVCSPGWSYDDAITKPMGSYGYSALSAGRAYSERVPSGALMIEPRSAAQPATRPASKAP